MNGEGYDPEVPVLPDVDLGYYLPDDVIEDFLTTYLKYSGDSQTSIERITTEFNVHTTYLIFGKFFNLAQTPTQARIRTRARRHTDPDYSKSEMLGFCDGQACPSNSDSGRTDS